MSNNVELISFCKSYGSTEACMNIDFFAEENSITGILGPNGAGKTSILKAICGLHYPTSGAVKVCGAEDSAMLRKFTAFVPEFPELDSRLTVRETLWLEAELSGQKKESAFQSVEKAVSICGLEDFEKSKVHALSKGYRQRTSLAKAICRNPKVLVLDEFSAGLDPAQTASFREKLTELSRSMTIILSTHRIDEASLLCSKLYIISRGEVAASGNRDSVIKKFGCRNLEEAFICATETKK
ncbi:ABC transporter ATP-binding protein [Treponema sp.]|uniref:ABC transporter ATP-binding protein n=1 Tax=Treponema sp. TaxID=166 RepID=UPI003F001A3B